MAQRALTVRDMSTNGGSEDPIPLAEFLSIFMGRNSSSGVFQNPAHWKSDSGVIEDPARSDTPLWPIENEVLSPPGAQQLN